MPVLKQVVRQAWRALGPDARGYSALTNQTTGAPTSDALKYLFGRITDALPARAVGEQGLRTISEAVAGQLTADIAAASTTLECFRVWHEQFKASYSAWVQSGKPVLWKDSHEAAYGHAYQFAETYGAATSTERAAVAWERLENWSKQPRPVFTTDTLSATVADPDIAMRVQARLDAAWAGGGAAAPARTGGTAPALGSMLEGMSVVSGSEVASAESEGLWEQAMRTEPALRTASEMGLTVHPVPQVPEVTSPMLYSLAPLDQSIHLRLNRMLRDQTLELNPELTIADALFREADFSGLVLGLESASERLVVALGFELVCTAGLATDRGGAFAVLERQWSRSAKVRQALENPGSLPDIVVAYVNDPSVFFMSRLWNRVHTTQFTLSRIGTAQAAWAQIWGVIPAVTKRVGDLQSKGIKSSLAVRADVAEPQEFDTGDDVAGDIAAALTFRVLKYGMRMQREDTRKVAFAQWMLTAPTPADPDWAMSSLLWDSWCTGSIAEDPLFVDPVTKNLTPITLSMLPSLSQAVVHMLARQVEGQE